MDEMGLLDSKSTENGDIEDGNHSGFRTVEEATHHTYPVDIQRFYTTRYKARCTKWVKTISFATIFTLLFICMLLHLQKKQMQPSTGAGKFEERLEKVEGTLNKTVLDQHNMKHHIYVNKKYHDWYLASNDYFYKLFQKPVAYRTARRNCKSEGAMLASAGMRNENVRRELTAKLIRPADHDTYIGLDDLQDPHNYVWSDGVLSTNANTQWTAGEPNKHGGVEACGEANKAQGWQINDRKCSVLNFYLCEVKHDHKKTI